VLRTPFLEDSVMRRKLALALLLLGTWTTGVRGGEEPPVKQLHMPKQAEPEIVVPNESAPPPGFYRRSRYEVWQYYGVDRTGHFRPRVILAPYYSSYYLYSGEAYPWVSTHQRDFMPYVSDAP
jgi:hypothetical protein